jgi:anionic cell wall polymer biosynthesis LytR-Cps2A-Psr (LCP) family protein
VDNPSAILDREYPDNNWGYQTFRLPAGKQTLDGATALKFVRSRHSTSDFDRSLRQQLVIAAIKDKLFSLDALTSPTKLQ